MSHYERLGVTPGASDAEIRAAYRVVARRVHPDANGSAPSSAAGAEMASVNAAYAVLRDPGRRARYDRERFPGDVSEEPRRPEPTSRRDDDDPPMEGVETAPAKVMRSLPFALALTVLAVIFVATAFATSGRRNSDGVGGTPVDDVLPFDNACPVGTESIQAFGSSQRVCVRAG
jgi:curved DNA-binding protein CbpA